jgi:hypothetical protein
MRTIYVAGYPRSGTTWLTRLLGDVLNCPTGSTLPKYDSVEPATEGQGRPGPFTIRKGHFALVDESGPVVPRGHALNYKRLTDESVVFVTRDTRDVVCSVCHYWGMSSIAAAIRNMASGATVRDYEKYMSTWLMADFDFAKTDYTTLWNDTRGEIVRIVEALGERVDMERLPGVLERQSFEARKKHAEQFGDTLPRGKAYHVRFYRRGGVGGWREQFTRQDGKLCQWHFGGIMAALGYIDDPLWWEKIER